MRPRTILAQLDHLLLLAVGLFDSRMINPLRKPGRLGPIDPLLLPSQAHHPLDQDFLGRIARLKLSFQAFSSFSYSPKSSVGKTMIFARQP